MNLDEFGLLMVLGVRVREVRELAEGHVWMPRRKLLLIDSEADATTRARLADQLATVAASLD